MFDHVGVALLEDHTMSDGTGWLVFSSGAPESRCGAKNNGAPGVYA